MADSEILDGIAAICIDVEGLNNEALYSAGGGTIPGIRDLPENLADGPMPAVVVLDAGKQVIPGSWERTTWTVELGVWTPDISPRGEAYRRLLDLDAPIRDAFRQVGGGLSDPGVQSVLITGSERIVGRQWQRGDQQPWFLVLPISIEVKVSRAVTYRNR